MYFSTNACIGAMTAQGPPAFCTKAVGSSGLKTKPEIKKEKTIKINETFYMSKKQYLIKTGETIPMKCVPLMRLINEYLPINFFKNYFSYFYY